MAAKEYGDELLRRLLTLVLEVLPGTSGVGLGLVDRGPDPGAPTTGRSVASVGLATQLDTLQWSIGKGPVWEALGEREPVVLPRPRPADATHEGEGATDGTADGTVDGAREGGGADCGVHGGVDGDRGASVLGVWLPDLGTADEAARAEVVQAVDEVRGMVVTAADHGGEARLVLSVYLRRAPTTEDVTRVGRLQPVLASAVTVVEHCWAQELRAEQMVQMMQYRRVIEQAKGLVMSALAVDAPTAFDTLARASQHFNVRLRNLTVALVEHVGSGAAEAPDDPEQVVTPSAQDRRVAAQVWAALSPSGRGRPGGADRGGPGRAPGGRGRDGGS